MNKKKIDNNKGFTLVELIVVLVILAILAAILVPALLGYIDRARGQQIVLNGRSVYTAAQAEATSIYGKSKAINDSTSGLEAKADRILTTADVKDIASKVIVGVKPTSAANLAKTTDHKNYTIVYVYYEENSKAVELLDGSWEEVEPGSNGVLSPTTPEGVTTFTIK